MLDLRKIRARRRIIGTAVIVAAVVIVLVAVVRPNPFSHTHSVWAEFDSVQGLGNIDRDVRVAGVNVGTIGAVQREGDNARVELVLDDDVDVHADARAELRPHTLFEGTAFVDLSPGSPSAAPINDGGEIPLRHTTVYISLDEALRVLKAPNRLALRSILREAANTFQDGAIDGLQHTLKASPELVANLAPTAKALTGPEGVELGHAVRGISDTVDDLAAHEGKLATLSAKANTTLDALNADDGRPLDRALRDLPGALEQLQRGGPGLARVVAQLGVIADRAEPAVPDLTAALRGSVPLVQRAPGILASAGPMVGDLRTVLDNTAAAGPSLESLIRELTPGTQLMASSVLPSMNAPTRLGLPAYMQLLSTLSSVTGASRGFQTPAQFPTGSGHALRLGAYLDLAGFAGSLQISCAIVAELSPEAAAQGEAMGWCSP